MPESGIRSPDQLHTPEYGPAPEAHERPESRSVEVASEPVGASTPSPASISESVAASITTGELRQTIEHVLEDGLTDLYRSLTPPQQAEFKRRGEETASRLAELIRQVQVKVQDILKLIRDWLMSIPGINHYFVEQEAKIKADKLLKLRR